MSNAFKTLPEWMVTKARAALANAQVGQTFNPFDTGLSEYGNVEIVSATGRARCRYCRQKINKGETAVRFQMDIGGCGSYTCTTAHVHLNDCNGK